MSKTFRRTVILPALVAIALAARAGFAAPPLATDEALIDWPMYNDPVLEQGQVIKEFDPRLKELWGAALARPDTDTRRRAADAITKAHREGMTGLESLAPQILAILNEQPK